MTLTRAQAKKIVLSFPGAEEGTAWGHAAFKVEGQFFTRFRDEDKAVVLIMGMDEREFLLEQDPQTFFITDHYRNRPAVLARLAALDAKTLRVHLERRWRKIMTKKPAKKRAAKPIRKAQTLTRR